MTNTWYFLITDNSTQFPKHSNMLKCVPVLVHQIIVISKDSRLICKNCSVFRICIEKRRKTQKKLFSFFLPLFFSEKNQIDRPVSPLKPRTFHQIFVIYIIQQYVWDRFDKIYNFLPLQHELKCTTTSKCTFFTFAFKIHDGVSFGILHT